MLILAVVLVLAVVVVLRTRRVLWRAVLRTWLVVATMALTTPLVTNLMPILTVLPAIMATVLLLIGQRLRSDTDTQQTNTGQRSEEHTSELQSR